MSYNVLYNPQIQSRSLTHSHTPVLSNPRNFRDQKNSTRYKSTTYLIPLFCPVSTSFRTNIYAIYVGRYGADWGAIPKCRQKETQNCKGMGVLFRTASSMFLAFSTWLIHTINSVAISLRFTYRIIYR